MPPPSSSKHTSTVLKNLFLKLTAQTPPGVGVLLFDLEQEFNFPPERTPHVDAENTILFYGRTAQNGVAPRANVVLHATEGMNDPARPFARFIVLLLRHTLS